MLISPPLFTKKYRFYFKNATCASDQAKSKSCIVLACFCSQNICNVIVLQAVWSVFFGNCSVFWHQLAQYFSSCSLPFIENLYALPLFACKTTCLFLGCFWCHLASLCSFPTVCPALLAAPSSFLLFLSSCCWSFPLEHCEQTQSTHLVHEELQLVQQSSALVVVLGSTRHPFFSGGYL